MKLFIDKLLLKIKNVWLIFIKLSLVKKGMILILILVVLIGGYKLTIGKKNPTPKYQTAIAEKGTLITSVSSSGNISASTSVTISTNATGIVREVYVKDGDIVSAGQSIAALTLDRDSQQKAAAANASYLSAQNNLNSANAKINSLQANMFRANQVFVKGAGNSSNPNTTDPTYIIQNGDWLQAEADYKNQQGVINQAQATLTSSALALSQTSPTITAPIGGTISNLSINPGSQLINQSANSSTTTSSSNTIGNIKLPDSNIQAIVNLSEIDVTSVKVGQKATLILDAFPNKTFTGKVTSINTNGTVSSGVTIYPSTITFDTSPENIYPNMAVTATIITDIKDNVVLVPSIAIQSANGQSFVRVQKNGNVTQTEVETRGSSDTQTEIISGLNEGDTVVVGTINTGSSSTSTTSPFGGSGIGGFGGSTRTGGTGGNATFRRAQ